MTGGDLDVNDARLAHLRWELALEDLVNGKEPLHPLQGHQDCALGTWIYGIGISRYGRHGSLWSLKTAHKAFHQVAEDTLAAIGAGNAARASKSMDEIRRLSGEILYQLTALELDVIDAAIEDARKQDVPSRLLRIFAPRPPSLDILAIRSCGVTGDGRRTLNVTGARLAHLKWIRDLQSAFRGLHGRNAAAQPSDECSLGVWIHVTAMKSLGATDALKALDAAHRQFHREVGIVLGALNQHKFRQADEAYESALALSGEIVTRLTRLQLEFVDSQLLSENSSKL